MNLDNVRSLKCEFLTRDARALALSAIDPSDTMVVNRSTKARSGSPSVLPMIAVGVAPNPKGNDFYLALRLEDRALAESDIVKKLTRKAKHEIDLRVVNRIQVLKTPWQRQRVRPIEPGISIGHYNVTAGTLGAFVRCRTSGKLRILSNNHVLADTNAGNRGDQILSPGRHDGGTKPEDVIGNLDRFKRISFTSANEVDAAIATLADGVLSQPNIFRGIGAVTGVAATELMFEDSLHVRKLGRTTGRRTGRITAAELSGLQVSFGPSRVAVFDNQIEIQSAATRPFSRGGDSGSLILTRTGLAIGLLFAGTESGGTNASGLTYANPIQAVLDALEVDLVIG